jgi:cyanate permease
MAAKKSWARSLFKILGLWTLPAVLIAFIWLPRVTSR